MSLQPVRWPLAFASRIADELAASLAPYCERIAVAGSIRRHKPDVGDIELVLVPKIEERQQQRPAQFDLFGAPADALLPERISLAWAHLDRLVEAGRLPAPTKCGDRYRCYPATNLAGQKNRVEDPSSSVWPADGSRWFDARPQDMLPAYVSLPQIDVFAVLPPAQWGPILAIRTGPAGFVQSLMIRLRQRGMRMDGGRVLNATDFANRPEEADFLAACGLPWIAPEDRR